MCTFERRAHFTSDGRVEIVREALLRTTKSCDVEIIAYCFMPDHLHMLLEGRTETSDLKQCVTRFRQSAGYEFKRSQNERLWQDGYFDRTLRDCDATFDVVAYVLANPVRARLCQTPTEYPFLGSSQFPVDELVLSVQWRP